LPARSPTPPATSPLIEAARAFDEALGQFGAVAESVGRAALDSGEGLARAAGALQKVAACEEEMQQRAQALSAALAAARQEQEAHARELGERALEVQTRAETYAALLQRLDGLGHDAADLNAAAQKLAAGNKIDRQMPPEAISPMLSQLAELAERMEGVALAAEALAGDARAARFDDLGGKTDALRQQLLAARNRLGLLKEALTQALPRINWS
jgi:chromosome segregation ATPase